MKKILLFFFFLLMSIGAYCADVSYQLTIDVNDFNGSSYAANNNEKTS